ncbi:MAG TPA: gliding motility-associated C-terminal domain-containing protein, partial [Bacteroidia bacterium]|nr:gliding motility-associated C-terminal domain-containing protein [Bacteroidia bacterium]
NPNANPGATTTYTVTGISVAGCSSTDTVSIQVDKPSITAGASSTSICNGASTSLDASGGTSYIWSPAASLSATSGAIVTGNPSSSTTYSVVGTDANGCKDSANVAITVNPLPVVSVSASNTTICAGSSSLLNASGASSYSWTPTGTLTCATCPSTSANPSSSTTYTVVGTSAAGCNDTVQINIAVVPIPVISINLSGNDTLCQGQSVNMTASGGATYTWKPSTALSATTGATVTSTPLTSPIIYTVVGSNGTCSDSASQSIYLYSPLSVTTSPDSICKGKNGLVGVIVTGGKPGYNYLWNNGLPNGAGPFTVSPATSTYYVCAVTDGCGTTIKDSEQVVMDLIPVIASFVDNPNSIWGGQYVSFVNSSTGASSYYWNFGDGNSSTDQYPYYQYNIPGTYVVYLVASNRFGCSDSLSDTVFVEGGIYVPNVFTPNGDGQNDVFHITAGGMQTYDLEIFNRWGQKVFETNSPNIDWSGKSMSGIDESDGIYYYIIKATDYSNKKYNLDGYLQLIR